MRCLMPPHALTNFEIQSIIRRNQGSMVFIQEINCLINLDEYADVGTHWIALF